MSSTSVAGPGVWPPQYDHVVVVTTENHNYDQIIANPQAPFINTLANGGALLTNYTALIHPSQPNYLALLVGSTFGVTADVPVTETGPMLATILAGACKTFLGYVEHPATSFDHNPWESFPGNPNVEQDFTTFPWANLASLPTVSVVAPNINDDMHNGTIQQGNTWLQANLGSYAQWAQANNSLLVVVWDQNGAETGIPVEPSNQVAAILYAPTLLLAPSILPTTTTTC
jgi:hypothetical protein